MIVFQVFWGAFTWALGWATALAITTAAIIIPIKHWSNKP